MKTYMVEGSDILDGYYLKEIKVINPEWFVYYYETGAYEGSGFAVWKKDKKYFYTDMGHCSCYGPLENIDDEMFFTKLKDIEGISKNYLYSEKVIQLIKDKKLR